MSSKIIHILVYLGLLGFCSCAGDKNFFYQVLDLTFSATDEEIKKAYQNLSKKYHPDNSGYSDRFIKIQRAYEALTNRIKKHIYDTDGLEEMERFEHAVANGYANQRYRRINELLVSITVDLDEVYKGTEKNIVLSRKSLCRKCHATGAKNGELKHCHHCHGRGVVFQQVQTNMGFMMQMQTTCPKCGGAGHMAHEKCPICGGSKMITENKNFKVVVEKGMMHGDEIVFEGEGDAYVHSLPGDVKFKLTVKPHATFTRERDDLYVKLPISFKEALFGFSKSIRHLDGRYVEISKSEPSQPNSYVIIKGEGMPKKNAPLETGDLYLELIIELPRVLNQEQKRLVKEILK